MYTIENIKQSEKLMDFQLFLIFAQKSNILFSENFIFQLLMKN